MEKIETDKREGQGLGWLKRSKLKCDCSISFQGSVVQVPKEIRGGC